MMMMRARFKPGAGGGKPGAALALCGLVLAFAALALAMLEGAVMRGAPAASRLAIAFHAAHAGAIGQDMSPATHRHGGHLSGAMAAHHAPAAQAGGHAEFDPSPSAAETPAPAPVKLPLSTVCCPLACAGLLLAVEAGLAPPVLSRVAAIVTPPPAIWRARTLEPPTPPPRDA
jgi:hypothetical protein